MPADVVGDGVFFPFGDDFLVELETGIGKVAHPLVVMPLTGFGPPFEQSPHAAAAGFLINHIPFDQMPAFHLAATEGVFHGGNVLVTGPDQEFPFVRQRTMDDLPGRLVLHIQPALVQRKIDSVVKLLQKLGIVRKFAGVFGGSSAAG